MAFESLVVHGDISFSYTGLIWMRHAVGRVQLWTPGGVVNVECVGSSALVREIVHGDYPIKLGTGGRVFDFKSTVSAISMRSDMGTDMDEVRNPDNCPVRPGLLLMETALWADYLPAEMVQLIGVLADGRILVACPSHSYLMSACPNDVEAYRRRLGHIGMPQHYTVFGMVDYFMPCSPSRFHIASIEVIEHACGAYMGMSEILKDFRALPGHRMAMRKVADSVVPSALLGKDLALYR